MRPLFALFLLLPAQGVEVSLEVEPERAKVGDPIVVRLTVRRDRDVEVEWPDLGHALAPFRVKEFGEETETREEGGRVVESRRFALTAALPGEFEIPAQAVRFRRGEAEGVRTTEPVRVVVESVLKEGERELRPTRGPLDPPASPLPWILGGLALAVSAILLARVLRRRALAPRPAPPPEPAHLRAQRRLQELASAPIEGHEAIGRFYDEVSGAVRDYVEARFGIRAPERTTEEFLREASSDGLFSLDHRGLLRSFLEACDLVKFARHHPPTSEREAALAAARRFVEETRPDRALASAAGVSR